MNLSLLNDSGTDVHYQTKYDQQLYKDKAAINDLVHKSGLLGLSGRLKEGPIMCGNQSTTLTNKHINNAVQAMPGVGSETPFCAFCWLKTKYINKYLLAY
jgi:hypothetical protein